MAQTTISITINTPVGMTVAEAIRLYTDATGYQTIIDGVANPETRAIYAKRMIARPIAHIIRAQRENEAYQPIVLVGEVTAD